MIKSKEDLKRYIKADLEARGVRITLINYLSAKIIPHPWYFQILLRKAEYRTNCGCKASKLVIGNLAKLRAYRYGAKCGYSIPLNVFGPGLCLGHIGTIVVNGGTKFGSNARIQACVNIGAFSKFDENWTIESAPTFGDNTYIGPGAKIFGKITIGNNVAIGANAVVSKNIQNHCTVIGSNQIINEKGSIDMIRYGDKSTVPEDAYIKRSNRGKE